MVVKQRTVRDGYKVTELGEIPVEWEVAFLGDHLIQYKEKSEENNQYPPLTSSRRGLFLQSTYFKKQIASKDNTGYNVVPRGYFTYRHMSDDETFYFNINNLVDKGIVSTLYPVFKNADSLNHIFLKTVLNEGKDFKKFSLLQKQGGSRTYMYFSKLKEFKFVLPPLKEQQKIAEILSTVDEQIENTDQLIAKTQELKKGLMQQLLTKGIGHTKFKETELGEIPVGWEICILKDISLKISIGLVTTMTKYYVDNGIPLIRNSDIKEGYISRERMVYLDEDFANKHESKKLLLDDIVTIHTGDIGTSALITKNLVGCQGFATLNTRVKPNVILPVYLMKYFNSIVAKQQFYNISTGDGRNNLNLKDFENTKVVVPNSLQEQQKIAEILSTVDDYIESYEQEKDKYLILKKGLMQQLLTGKIRVKI
jgi:type I restriction enzyme, S subunit